MSTAVPGHDQRRHPRLGPGLDAVRAAEGARRCAERRLHRARRRRLLGHELLRRADRDAEHRPHRRRGRALHAVAHDRPVLADPVLPADRPQPHPQQHGLHHRGGRRVSERERHDPARERDAPRDPRRARLEHLHGRQVAPLPDRGDEPRVHPPQLAERPRLRALVRVPGRRDEPVVPGPRVRQPPGGPAEDARRGLPLLGRHHRQGARVHQGRQVHRARQAVLPVLRARRGPRAAPRPEGVDRPVQGPLRHGLRGDARGDARPPEGDGPRPGRHRAAAAQPDRHVADAPGAGRASRSRRSSTRSPGTRSRTTRSGCSRGWPRSTRASWPTPTTRSAGCSTTSRRPASATTRWSSSCPTTARAARAARTGRSTRTCCSTAIPDNLQANLAMLDELGGPTTYNHYPNGWAMAFNTPFKMWKRYEFNGGTSDPCIISWPGNEAAAGQIREQYHHAVDLVPTILDLLGVEAPAKIKGHVQSHFDGVSMRSSLADASAPSPRHTQFYSMLGSRAIWHDGWKAITTHPTLSGWSHFGDDTWELYHTDVDRSELHDLAAEHAREAARDGEPLVRRGRPERRLPAGRPVAARDPPDTAPAAGQPAEPLRLLPGHRRDPRGPVGQHPQPLLRDRGARRHPGAGCPGRAVRPGRTLRRALAVHQGEPAPLRQQLRRACSSRRSSRPRTCRRARTSSSSASFEKDGEDPPHVSTGILSLYHGDRKVGEGRIKTQPGLFSVAGEGLCVGRDSSDPVTADYPGEAPYRFTGGIDPSRRGGRERRAVRRHGARSRRDAVAGVASGRGQHPRAGPQRDDGGGRP